LIERIFILILVIILIYILYSVFYVKVKSEKEFAQQVYSYLKRRYSNTSIVDYGGMSSDPIILSRNAGPFKTLEIVVVTEKQGSHEDRDIIVKGEINRLKYEFTFTKDITLDLNPRKVHLPYKTETRTGISHLDNRFNLTTNDRKFTRDIFNQTDLSTLITKSYDLEEYKIHLSRKKESFVQIRMETMNTNSFLQAFNLLLSTIGLLTEKGYIRRGTSSHQIQDLNIPKIEDVPTYKDNKITRISRKDSIPTITKEKSMKSDLYSVEQKQQNSYSNIVLKEETAEEIPTKEKYSYLFSSLVYRTKDIVYKKDIVIIENFSTDLPDIRVEFLKNEKARLRATSDQSVRSGFELIIKNTSSNSKNDWNKLWNDISVTGPAAIVDSLKIRSGLAHKINKIGDILIEIRAEPDLGIIYNIIIPLNKESIELGYEIINDLMWIVKLNL